MRQVRNSNVMSLTVGCSVGTIQAGNIVIDTTVLMQYQVQPGRQEWVTVIECISAAGEKLAPFIIFKGENFLTTWLPNNVSNDWQFSVNSKG